MSTFGDIKVSTINGGPTGAKNAIINGNFGINQRGVSGTVTLSAGVYGHDRWKAGSSGCTYTFATSDNVTTIDISAGSLIQVIEGINLESGTYTLSWTGTAQGKIGAGSYGNSGITGTATGGTNLDIEFDTGTVSLVQFEPGTVVTPFERRQFGTELALCMRYFQKTFSQNTAPADNQSGQVESGLFAYDTGDGQGQFTRFVVTMRASPTISFFRALNRGGTAGQWATYDGSNWTSLTNSTVLSAGLTENGFTFVGSRAGAFVGRSTYLLSGHYTASSEL
jgi:hypothetical protein